MHKMRFTPGHFLRMPERHIRLTGLDIRSGLETKLQAPVSKRPTLCRLGNNVECSLGILLMQNISSGDRIFIHFLYCTAHQYSPLRRNFMECSINNLALSLLMKHLVIGQR